MTVAKYFIAQYTADVFRREARNIGVVVTKGAERVAKFVGETAPGVIDGRKTKGFVSPDIYAQWVQYWRHRMGVPGEMALQDANGPNYVMIPAGEVENTGTDSALDVAAYLYAMLVSEGGAAEAIGPTADEVPAGRAKLRDDVADALSELELLAKDDAGTLAVRHPVRRDAEVRGQLPEPHKPAFVQENGRLYVMETVDFGVQPNTIRDHAGWAAYMFADLQQARQTEAIAIVRNTEAAQEIQASKYAMAVLRTRSSIVDWDVDADREQFLKERLQIARR